jgi:hypothetical protein
MSHHFLVGAWYVSADINVSPTLTTCSSICTWKEYPEAVFHLQMIICYNTRQRTDIANSDHIASSKGNMSGSARKSAILQSERDYSGKAYAPCTDMSSVASLTYMIIRQMWYCRRDQSGDHTFDMIYPGRCCEDALGCVS